MSTNFNHDRNYDDIKSLLEKVRKANLNESEEMIKTQPEEVADNKEGDKMEFEGINTIGYLSKADDVQLSETGRSEFESAVGEMIKGTGILTPYVNVRLENGRVIITTDVIKNPSLESVKELVIDTDEEDPTINLVGGTLTLNGDLLNLLNTISRTYNDPQIGRNNLVKSTTSQGEPQQ
jgi:hypothetical protein